VISDSAPEGPNIPQQQALAPPGQPDYDVKGFSLIGPPPLGVVHVPWSPRLHVMYGANGAGKSRVLNGIRDALSGVAQRPGGRAFMHVQLHTVGPPRVSRYRPTEGSMRPPPDLALHLHQQLLACIKAYWMEELGEPGSESEDLDNLAQFRALEDVASMVRAFLWQERAAGNALADLPAELEDELSRQGLFSLLAQGTESEPRWALYVSGRPDEDHPELRAHLGRGREEAIRLDDVFRKSEWDALRSLDLEAHPYGAFLNQLLPGWVPVPVVRCLRVELDSWPLPRLVDVGPASISRQSEELAEVAAKAAAQWSDLGSRRKQQGPATVLFDQHDGHPRPKPRVVEGLELLSRDVSDELQRFLEGAPTLTCRFAEPPDWLRGHFLSWEAVDGPSGDTVPLESLSDAEYRWAEIAIRLVAARYEDPGPRYHVLLLDEPERALHSRAVPPLVNALAELPQWINGPVYAATHAAPFLEHTEAVLLHVRRDRQGESGLLPLELEASETLPQMARRFHLRQSDLLRLYKTFLIVEGAHDQAVIDEILGDDLAAGRVRIVPMRGARRALSVAEGEILLDFTDARIVIALDHTHTSLVAAIDSVTEMAHKGDIARARQQIQDVTRLVKVKGGELTGEEQTAVAIVRQGFEFGTWNRVAVFGFSKPDIIQYLPVQQLVPEAHSWRQLTAEWRRAPSRPTYKDWLVQAKGATLNEARLRAAARHLTAATLHPDFNRLLDACMRPDRPSQPSSSTDRPDRG